MEGKKAELKHKDFIKKIRKEVETLKDVGIINEREIFLRPHILIHKIKNRHIIKCEF